MQQSGDWYDHMTILVGSAIRLLCGEAGLFVVSNEAFDPQSSAEYTLYRLEATQLPTLLDYLRQVTQPNSSRIMVSETLPSALVKQLKQEIEDDTDGSSTARMAGLAEKPPFRSADTQPPFRSADAQRRRDSVVAGLVKRSRRDSVVAGLVKRSRRDSVVTGLDEMNRVERCSLLVADHAGVVGVLHALRPVGMRSCFEGAEETEETEGTEGTGGALRLFMAQLATGLRAALKSQSLVKEQARLAAIFEHSTDGILTVDNALRIIDFNPAMEQLTGWHESEVLGRFYHHVLRPKDRLGNELGLQGSPILQAFAGQSVVNREMVISARDGQRFAVCVTASCVRSSRGEPINGILNVRDITREREQEEQRWTFISVISHELQTPIAIIKGYASTLARTDATFDGEALHSRLLAIEEEADRLNKLVGNLLYASRIQAGGLLMDVAPLELAPLIEAVVRRLKAKSPDWQVTLDLPPNLPAVMADRDRIEEVLQNLLDNAIKYSPRQRTLTVTCSATGDEVIVSVSDTGMGIPVRDQAQIFNRFQRVDDKVTQS